MLYGEPTPPRPDGTVCPSVDGNMMIGDDDLNGDMMIGDDDGGERGGDAEFDDTLIGELLFDLTL